MPATPGILISAAAALIVLGVIVVMLWRKGRLKKTSTNYYALFIMGMIWLAVGIPLGNYALSVMGFIFMLLGLAHRTEWKQNQEKHAMLRPGEDKVMLIIMLVLLFIIITCVVLMVLMNRQAW